MSETDELSMLFSEEQVGSYVVKGWTLRQFQALLPIIMTAIEALKEHGVTWEDIGEDQEKTMAALQVAVKALIPHGGSHPVHQLGNSRRISREPRSCLGFGSFVEGDLQKR